MGYSSVASSTYRDEYNAELVGKWDVLADWNNRLTSEGSFFVDLLNRYGAKTVLDSAAGTGYHCWLLHSHGFATTASDGSAAMVRQCRKNLRARDVDIPVFEADWRHLTESVTGRFDAVLCLGNSFCHLFNEEDRRASLNSFHKILNPNGILVIDSRNYERIIRERFVEQHTNYCCRSSDVTITATASTPDTVRVRYQFPDGTSYNIVQAPVLQDELTNALRAAGFDTIEKYGDLSKTYNPNAVEFVVQLARKTQTFA